MSPPPSRPVERALYGFTQPAIGARLVLQHRTVLEMALLPATMLAGACVLFAILSPGEHGFLRRFYELFAWLAPLPSIVFSHHYARLATAARDKFGFSPSEPCIEGLARSLRRLVAQTVLIAVAVAPLGLLRDVPILGHWAWRVVLALWGLHWIVVDAFDSARVLAPGQTLADVDRAVEALPSPWFVRAILALRDAVGRDPLRVFTRFARLCDRLAKPWRDELHLVEHEPMLVLGFALSTALLLATPVLNLLFRPIVIVAATHVLGQLEATGAATPVTENVGA